MSQYYEMSIPIKNLFPVNITQIFGNQIDPDKWDPSHCEKFFNSILKEYSEEKIMWNNECKKELITSLNTIIEDNEQFVKIIIKSHLDANKIDEQNKKSYFQLIKIVFNSDIYNNSNLEEFNKEEYYFTKPLFNIDFKGIKMNYKTLKKEVYILNTYINQFINSKKEINPMKQKKLWKKLKKNVINNNEDKTIVILKAMILLYKKYFLTIGEFDCYNLLMRLFKTTNSEKIKNIIIQLFEVSIMIDDEEIKQNNIDEINKEDISIMNSKEINKIKYNLIINKNI
jgi:transcriptional regulator of met regulon